MDIDDCQKKIEKSKHRGDAGNKTGERGDESGILERKQKTAPEKRRAEGKTSARPPESLVIKPPHGFTRVGERLRRKRLSRKDLHPAAPEGGIQVAVLHDAVPHARDRKS